MSHDLGMDILGAANVPPPKKLKVSNATAKAKANRAISHLTSTAKRLAKRRPKTAAKLLAHGNKLANKATQIKGLPPSGALTAGQGPSLRALATSATSTPGRAAPSTSPVRTSRLDLPDAPSTSPVRTSRLDLPDAPSSSTRPDTGASHLDRGGTATPAGQYRYQLDVSNIDMQHTALAADRFFYLATALDDVIAVAGDIINAILPVVDQLNGAGQQGLAIRGQGIADQAQVVIDNFDPDAGDQTGPQGRVAALQTAAAAWQSQAAAALSAAPSAPGTEGGGGAGGGGEMPSDEGGGESPAMSPELQDFREGGDPLADTGAESVPIEEGGEYDDFDQQSREAALDDDVVGNAGLPSSEEFWSGGRIAKDSLMTPTEAPTLSERAASPALAAALEAARSRLAAAQAAQASYQPVAYAAPAAYSAPKASSFAERLAQARGRYFQADEQGETTVSGEFREFEDLKYIPWTEEITDEPADPHRRTASTHAGTSYLQNRSYPRYGESSGQEGGSMIPTDEIEAFLGESDHDTGMEILGAVSQRRSASRVPPRAGFVQKTAPGGGKYTSLVMSKPKPGEHAKSIKNAQDAGKRAVSMAGKLSKALKKTKIHGDDFAGDYTDTVDSTFLDMDLNNVSEFIGVLQTARQKEIRRGLGQHPKVKGGAKIAAKLAKIAKAVDKVGKGTIDKANQHGGAVTARTKTVNAAGATQTRLLLGKGQTQVRGLPDVLVQGAGELDDDLVVGAEEYELMGAVAEFEEFATEIIGEALEGLLDPASGDVTLTPESETGAAASAAEATAETEAEALPDPDKDPSFGVGAAPTAAPELQAGVDYMNDPTPDQADPTVYSSDPTKWGNVTAAPEVSGIVKTPVPQGAVYYDTSHGMGSANVFGSFGRFKPGGGRGYMRGSDGWDARELTNNPLNLGGQQGIYRGGDSRGDDQDAVDIRIGPFGTATAAVAYDSIRQKTGTLLARKTGDWTDGLRYDTATDNWFWFRDKAPDWAKVPGDVLRLNQAIVDYKAKVAAAAADAAAAAAQAKLDSDQADALRKQQAAEDGQIARQHKQEQDQASHEADLQAKADEVAQKQAGAQQELDIKALQAQAEVDRAADLQQADIEQRAFEAAQRFMPPPAADSTDEPGAMGDEGGYAPGEPGVDERPGSAELADALETMDLESTTVMGSQRLKLRRRHR